LVVLLRRYRTLRAMGVGTVASMRADPIAAARENPDI